MEKREIAISLSGVKKRYRLGQIGGGTLQGDLQSWWARIRGREDPNTRIGTDPSLAGQTFLALKGIDLTVYKGEALGIIGGNGAGKSTLLKLLSRVTAPTEGQIDIYGRIASMLEVGTGFSPEMTGRENVYMNGAILGMTKGEIDAKMDDIIAFSEIREFIDTPVKRYSSGMYVKLAFAVAAHLDAEILIMDEVLAVGDMAFQKKCLEKMREAAQKEGRTVLYVSHNMQTIRQLCDRCLVLDRGRVVFAGDVDKAISIYMDSESNADVSMDFSDWERPRWLQNPQIKLLSAKFEGKESNCFDDNEPMYLQMQWTNLQAVADVCLRIEILTLEGTPLATYVLWDFYSGQQGQRAEAVFRLDIGQLMDGRYKMKYAFFCRDALGNHRNMDFARGLCFRKTSIHARENIRWDTKQWGHIRLPMPRIEKIEPIL